MRALLTDLRLAWLLTRGSDRREWWRVGLTAFGAALATGIGLAVVALLSLDGFSSVSFGSGLFDSPSDRRNVSLALGLLLIPVLGFLGQCARIGAVHRDRRLAALRLAGAGPWQVRRIAALESGLACLAGAVVATAAVAVPLLPYATAWAGVVVLAVPVLGAVVSGVALRRVVADPLGRVRRVRPVRGPGRLAGTATRLLAVTLAALALTPVFGSPVSFGLGPVAVLVLAVLVSLIAIWLSGASSRQLGEGFAAGTSRPALLIAAERLREDPWSTARTHAALLLVTVVGSGFAGVRQILLAYLTERRRTGHLATHMAYYTTGIDLTAAAILVALALALTALAVSTAESLAVRRRGLAAQAAAGVPHAVLARALLLETALPLFPAIAVAGLGGTAISFWYGAAVSRHTDVPVPYAALLVPVGVYAACVLAAATSLPLLRRSVRPGELRYA
ncbi:MULTISPECIES: ABC transporter permease [unclassified Streptomyces]|uniref:ABC transporter permease n=1 Tax=unclassified Streptomyces TaxID=2593676 RepID=UPI00403C4A0E